MQQCALTCDLGGNTGIWPRMSVLWWRGYVGIFSQHWEIGSQWNGMESWQERRLKLVSNLAPVMITGALEFVHMYVGRYMSYIFYTDILFQYLKGIKEIMNLKKYIFICLSASWQCSLKERREWTHQHCRKRAVECWIVCVKCKMFRKPAFRTCPRPLPPPLFFVSRFSWLSALHSQRERAACDKGSPLSFWSTLHCILQTKWRCARTDV